MYSRDSKQKHNYKDWLKVMLFNTPVSKKTIKKRQIKKDKKSQTPSNTGQQKLEIGAKEEQKTLLEFCSA